MISKNKSNGSNFDVILITAEYYDDHPLSPAGIIARVLDAKGFSVGILEKPVSKEDFLKLGIPKLFFGITSGSIDSMLNNYTPLKKSRADDKFNKTHKMPDRAVIFYCNKLREYFKDEFKKDSKERFKVVIGGIESSLRRFAHYDYWDNDLRKSILLDSRADILVYGNGEKQTIEIANRLKDKKDLKGILGTCILSKELPKDFVMLPRFIELKDKSIAKNKSSADSADQKNMFAVEKGKIAFCEMQRLFSMTKNLAQEYDNNYVLQYEFPKYTPSDLDWVYSLPFSRKLHKDSLLKMARFSVITHRGCLGKCSFCSIALHQGDKIISRSEQSILKEIEKIAKFADFSGVIDDLGGPSANMYGMDFDAHGKLDLTHKRLIELMRKARQINGIKKIFVRSGIRYDFALNSKEYIKELSEHHVSGCLKIAPEHVSEGVLMLMNKNTKKLQNFIDTYNSINKDKKQYLAYYFMIGHPGDSIENVRMLKRRMNTLDAESFQLFTPTPMTISTCMYYTGLNPYTMLPVNVTYDYATKKKMKDIMFN